MRRVLSLWGLVWMCLSAFAQQPSSPLEASFLQYQQLKTQSSFPLEWVPLGPTLNSARADVVQVDPRNPATMYIGFGSGSLWKTINHGQSWNPVFEGQSSFSIGDMELAPSNPSIIYLGTGENLKKPRNFTLPGTGMYRSVDAGKTWQHIGLEDSWAIAEIAIHPKDPNIVFVAVLGHLWSKNPNRGLFRTLDGGKSWQKVLYKDDMTGANEVVISPTNPMVMYASLWEVYPDISGKNSGVYRSIDGGKTWVPCTKGLPSGPRIGRIGLAVSQTNPKKAYALIDNLNNATDEAAELYKTTDGGLSWSKTHTAPLRIFPGIGWYFTDVYVNPKNDEEVFCLGVRLANSVDGGKTFAFIGGEVTRMNPSLAQGLHLDQCELWIDPQNPQHMALGNDGGFYVTYDKGASWVHYNNIPTGEFYDITIDQKNYIIYGGTQDDATVYGPAKELNPRFPGPWKYLWIDSWDGGDGCVSQVDPDDPGIVYYSMQHGAARRLDLRTDVVRSIQPRLPRGNTDTLNFNYITPYFISPHQGQTLYHGGNYIFKSVDRGNTWHRISPNLANSAIPAKKSFSTGALVESKLTKGLLYAGTDRGAFWVSANDGASWQEHSTGLANNYIRSICPSRFVRSRVYVAMTGLNYDDLQAYLYVSEDNGANWKSITATLPNEPVNVVLEDPVSPDILYVGTMRGVYVSFDRGNNWSYLGKNLPATAVADLEIHESSMELVVATHGRGLYKLSLRPLQSWITGKLAPDQDHFFEIPPATRPWHSSWGGAPDYRTVEKVPLTFWLNAAKPISLSLRDSKNKELWRTSIEGSKGFNQFRWDLIYNRQKSDLAYFVHYEQFLSPGSYQMVLSDGKNELQRPLVVSEGVSPYVLEK